MWVAIDTTPLATASKFRGVGLYTKKLLEGLNSQGAVKIITFEGKNIPPSVNLVHYPYFSPFFLSLPPVLKIGFVVTVHDLIPLVFPKAYPPGIKGKVRFLIQRKRVKNAKMIITDSESSKKDINKYLGIPVDRIRVVYLAAANNVKRINDKNLLEKVSQKFNLPKRFVLYVGDVNFNKNLPSLLKACLNIKIPLVIVGRQAVQKDFDLGNVENAPLIELNKLIEEKGGAIKLGYVEENDLSALYSLANVYCQPSYYEGFGLQILEAFACGVPVVAGNVSSMPEVAGDAAVLVNPYSVDNIAEGIVKIINNEQMKKELINRGYERAKKFSWEKTVQETIKVYEEVLEG